MLVVNLHFEANRYHATPWESHVNEANVEWPPSPWRFLRALIAVYYTRSNALDSEVFERLVAKLSAHLPIYRLPKGTLTHTRHYMPVGTNKADMRDQTAKVWDAFVALPPDDASVQIGWPGLELEEPERLLLDSLLANLTYLGRAESWVNASRIPDNREIRWNVFPDSSEDRIEIQRLLAPLPNEQIEVWRAGALERERDALLAQKRLQAEKKGKDPAKEKLSKEDERRLSVRLPENALAALSQESADLRSYGWSQPPGSRWVAYGRPTELFSPSVRREYKSDSLRPTLLRFAISSSVRPLLSDALSFGERVRSALIKWSNGSSVFTGRAEDGVTIASEHLHAHIFSESQTEDGRISHFSVYSPSGFSRREREAASKLRRVWGREGHDIDVVLISVSDTHSVRTESEGFSIFGASRVWESVTPFVSTRHPKYTKSGVPKLDENGVLIGSSEHDLRRLLEARGFPALESIERLEKLALRKRALHWRNFGTKRQQGGGLRPHNVTPVGYRLTFQEPVEGPIALGFGAHFGLGLFGRK